MKFKRYYTELSQDYWNRNYLDYESEFRSIISLLIEKNGLDENKHTFISDYICFNHLVYWKKLFNKF